MRSDSSHWPGDSWGHNRHLRYSATEYRCSCCLSSFATLNAVCDVRAIGHRDGNICFNSEIVRINSQCVRAFALELDSQVTSTPATKMPYDAPISSRSIYKCREQHGNSQENRDNNSKSFCSFAHNKILLDRFISYFSFFFPSLSSPKKANPTATKPTARMPIHISTPETPCVSRFTKK